jgi:hypothetical protein
MTLIACGSREHNPLEGIMSTRAVYGFSDEHGIHHVYVHHDGYPIGAADKFSATLASGNAWPLPRFEADEFAAAFVAINKRHQGGVRLTSGPEAHGDIEYYYVVSQGKTGHLYIEASTVNPTHQFFRGWLEDFIRDAKQIEKAEAA